MLGRAPLVGSFESREVPLMLAIRTSRLRRANIGGACTCTALPARADRKPDRLLRVSDCRRLPSGQPAFAGVNARSSRLLTLR